MKIETKFNLGDKVYAVHKEYSTDSWLVHGPLTIETYGVNVDEDEIVSTLTCKENSFYYREIRVFGTKSAARAQVKLLNERDDHQARFNVGCEEAT